MKQDPLEMQREIAFKDREIIRLAGDRKDLIEALEVAAADFSRLGAVLTEIGQWPAAGAAITSGQKIREVLKAVRR